MKTRTASRVLRFGAARDLTRAVLGKEHLEPNASRTYDIPTGE